MELFSHSEKCSSKSISVLSVETFNEKRKPSKLLRRKNHCQKKLWCHPQWAHTAFPASYHTAASSMIAILVTALATKSQYKSFFHPNKIHTFTQNENQNWMCTQKPKPRPRANSVQAFYFLCLSFNDGKLMFQSFSFQFYQEGLWRDKKKVVSHFFPAFFPPFFRARFTWIKR